MKFIDKPIFEALTDWQLLGLNIEREAGGEPREGRIAIGTITLERVDHRKWDGNTIQEVILWPWQFSWTMPEAGEDYYEVAVRIARNFDSFYALSKPLAECVAIARGLIDGTIPRDPDLKDCFQYLNPKASKSAAKTKSKWLAAGMTIIKKIGKHEFFKEA
jgi:hypothetical protein